MERLVKRSQLVELSLKSLGTALNKFSELDPTDYFYQEVRDSVIQRFEYSMDTFWKYLREYLLVHHGIDVPATPKAVFKAGRDAEIIDDRELALLASMIEDRNLTSHAYNLELAQDISCAVVGYYPSLVSLVNRLKK